MSGKDKMTALLMVEMAKAIGEAREIAIILAEKDAKLQLGEGATDEEISALKTKIIDKLREDDRVKKAAEQSSDGVMI